MGSANESWFDGYVESKKQSYLPCYDDTCSVKMEFDHDIPAEELKEIFGALRVTFGKRKAQLTNEMTIRNEQLQSERHDIFERYRKSGGKLWKTWQDCCTQHGSER